MKPVLNSTLATIKKGSIMKIVKLTAENFKRLEAVEITPDGNTVLISGRNGQGKSSVLDSILAALFAVSAVFANLR